MVGNRGGMRAVLRCHDVYYNIVICHVASHVEILCAVVVLFETGFSGRFSYNNNNGMYGGWQFPSKACGVKD
jgi:hypothetical protein